MATLPRPSRSSRPSLPVTMQPTGPPPSIPLPKSRNSSIPTNGSSTPGSALPQPSSARTASSSSLPNSASPHTSATSFTSAASHTPTDAIRPPRKKISYNSFPRPPNGNGTPNGISPSSSTSTTPRSSRQASALPNGVGRSVSVQSAGTRASHAPLLAAELQTSPMEMTKKDEGSRGRHRPSSSHGKDKGNVVISVRVRPEKDANDQTVGAGEWIVEGKKSLVSYRGKEGGEYVYDNVFTAHDKNEKVYNSAAKRLVRRVMEGYNGTVFAYGMTGTGKTYSMQGTHQHPGVTPSAITDIFSYIRETPQREFLLRVSYLEIYNEKIHDLLEDPLMQTGDEIKLREDPSGNVIVTPLKEELVQSPTQLLRVIARGDMARKTSSTQYNARSSRSHAVVRVVVESRERQGASTATLGAKKGALVGTRISTLSLIDLAGSERAAETKERREEGSHINRSLLTLGTVISKLTGKRDKNGEPTDKQGKHLPYRDSKLTRLLQPALAGNSLISILCTIQLGSAGSAAAAGSHIIETLNTLKFAARARNNIVSHAKRSEDHANINDAGSRALLDRYAEEIRDLKKQLDSKNSESDKIFNEAEESQRKEEERTRDEERVTELHLAQLALGDRIRHLNALILSSKSTGVNQMRSHSSLSLLQQRLSTMSNATDARSVRSSTSTHTLDAKRHKRKSDETANEDRPRSPNLDEEDDDVNGHGDASKDAQIKALHTDLADKNRYIESLESRLRQARRSSKSRVSMMFQGRHSSGSEQVSHETAMQEKNAEISELKEQLDDCQRSLVALRSATRMRDTTADLTPSSTPTPTPLAQRSGTSSHLSKRSAQTLGGAEHSDAAASLESRSNRRTSLQSTVTDGEIAVPYRSGLLASRRSSTGPSALNLRHQTTSPTRSPLNESTITTDAFPIAPTRSRSDGPKSLTSAGQFKINHGLDEKSRYIDDLIRKQIEEQDRKKQDGLEPSASDGRTNSLNLLAMRSSTTGKQKRNPTLSTASEGIGLGVASNEFGLQRTSPDAESSTPSSATSGKLRVGLSVRDANADIGRATSRQQTSFVKSSPANVDPDRTILSSSPKQGGEHFNTLRRTSAVPGPLRLRGGSPNAPSLPPPPPPPPSQSNHNMSSTNAAAQATNALRGGQSPKLDDTPEDSEAEGEGIDTVASSTVGAPTVYGDSPIVGTSKEPMPDVSGMHRVAAVAQNAETDDGYEL